MMIRRPVRLALVLALVMNGYVPASQAATDDFSGTWVGSMEVKDAKGRVTKDPAYLVLKQDGSKLTGTAGDSQDHQFAIKDAVVKGNSASFTISFGPTIRFKLKQQAKVISGTVEVEAAGAVSPGTLTAKRK